MPDAVSPLDVTQMVISHSVMEPRVCPTCVCVLMSSLLMVMNFHKFQCGRKYLQLKYHVMNFY